MADLGYVQLEQSVGVILANETTPMQNVVFEDVRVIGEPKKAILAILLLKFCANSSTSTWCHVSVTMQRAIVECCRHQAARKGAVG